jgi:cyanuric acid amidohydrolase
MPAISVDVVRIPTKGPGDVSGLMRLIEAGKVSPSSILAVLGKTEGNGGVNDFTREYAMAVLCDALSPYLGLTPRAVEDKIAFVMSGGTEGVLSPHLTVFARSLSAEAPNGGASDKRLSIGIAHSRDFLPEEIGRKVQIEETVKGSSGHARRQHWRPARRAFCTNQVPLTDKRTHRGGASSRAQDGHH